MLQEFEQNKSPPADNHEQVVVDPFGGAFPFGIVVGTLEFGRWIR